jgi:hypothetical protein
MHIAYIYIRNVTSDFLDYAWSINYIMLLFYFQLVFFPFYFLTSQLVTLSIVRHRDVDITSHGMPRGAYILHTLMFASVYQI